MAYQQAGEEKPPIPMWAIIAAAVALLAFVVWWGYKNFGPQNPPLTAKNVQVNNMLEEMAKKSGGDFSKLSPEDQQKVRSAAGAFAPLALHSVAVSKGYAK